MKNTKMLGIYDEVAKVKPGHIGDQVMKDAIKVALKEALEESKVLEVYNRANQDEPCDIPNENDPDNMPLLFDKGK